LIFSGEAVKGITFLNDNFIGIISPTVTVKQRNTVASSVTSKKHWCKKQYSQNPFHNFPFVPREVYREISKDWLNFIKQKIVF
jgi:hypothetical protein